MFAKLRPKRRRDHCWSAQLRASSGRPGLLREWVECRRDWRPRGRDSALRTCLAAESRLAASSSNSTAKLEKAASPATASTSSAAVFARCGHRQRRDRRDRRARDGGHPLPTARARIASAITATPAATIPAATSSTSFGIAGASPAFQPCPQRSSRPRSCQRPPPLSPRSGGPASRPHDSLHGLRPSARRPSLSLEVALEILEAVEVRVAHRAPRSRGGRGSAALPPKRPLVRDGRVMPPCPSECRAAAR